MYPPILFGNIIAMSTKLFSLKNAVMGESQPAHTKQGTTHIKE